jgi:hypothetical protein
MAKTIIWDRTKQNVVLVGGQALVFASGTDADVWLARGALKTNDQKNTKQFTGVTSTTYDKISVT